MIAAQRRRHLRIWVVLAIALPTLVVVAFVVRPSAPPALPAREAPP